MSKNGTTKRQNDTIHIKFRQLLTVPAATLGFHVPANVLVPPEDECGIGNKAIVGMLAQLIESQQDPQMLVGVDIFDQPWVLVAGPGGTGWTKLKTSPLAEPEEKKTDLTVGPEAVDLMNALPPVKG